MFVYYVAAVNVLGMTIPSFILHDRLEIER